MVESSDVTFTQCSATVWSLLEINLGILCNSLVALKPLVRRYMPSLFSKTGSGGVTGSNPDDSYAKRCKGNHGRWGHSYQLHSFGNEKTEQSAETAKDNIVIVDQFSVEYDSRKNGTHTVVKGDSTDSILAVQYPAHHPV